ncbi:hypothetical protein [Alkalicoccus urumqiensis]|uniref:hypothetical protein n=1 Tax=Alkalicoccus urumqiensis TaxID=1548213 RepID=UPI0015E5D979|nr:hypothetical protein [Alkalicoccus urumqiensis]
MDVSRQDILRLLDGMTEDDLRIVFTMVEEYRIAEKKDHPDIRHFFLEHSN